MHERKNIIENMSLGFLELGHNWISISNNIVILCYIALCFSFIEFLVTCITLK